ncbi:acyl carrier protein [Amycolatopsis sp. NPDC051758]|uniref:acyl carrier protein n=1 Tax=Amycolatopsis sp. NPDC051758 TaxID=3363935 RepID=UPI0037B926E4
MTGADGNPSTMERWVIDACVALGLSAQSPSDDFFALGGTSLSVIRLVARAEEKFGESCLPPDELYEESTVRGIAGLITRNAESTAESAGGQASRRAEVR